MVALLVLIVVVIAVAVVVTCVTVVRTVRQASATPIDLSEVVGTIRDDNDRVVEGVLAAAGARLDDRLSANRRENDLRTSAIDDGLRSRNSEISVQLLAVQEGMRRMNEEVTRLSQDRAVQHSELVTRITQTAETQRELASTTSSLREALANPKARGAWGERTADDVLRRAGFVHGINYRRQAQTPDGTQPDFTFLLPEGRELNMDVKFPADNYIRHLEADNDIDRERFRKAFLADVRARMKELSGRSYIDPERTLDHILLFIPNESIYSFIHEQDARIADDALARKIILCSPFTLFGVLSVIRQSVDLFRLERQGNEIHRCLTEFSKEWGKFTDIIETVDRRLGSLNTSFEDLKGVRAKKLQAQLDRIDALDPPDEPGATPTVEALSLVLPDDSYRARDAG